VTPVSFGRGPDLQSAGPGRICVSIERRNGYGGRGNDVITNCTDNANDGAQDLLRGGVSRGLSVKRVAFIAAAAAWAKCWGRRLGSARFKGTPAMANWLR